MTLEELRAEGQRLYYAAEAFYTENSQKIDALRANYDAITILSKREKLDREAAEMLLANAKQFENLVKNKLKERPDLESLLSICCRDFYRSRLQMSKTGQRFYDPQVIDFF